MIIVIEMIDIHRYKPYYIMKYFPVIHLKSLLEALNR